MEFLQDKLREEHNQSDPNVDLFLATIDGDVDALRAALKRNANPNITIDSLFNKYSVELCDFAPSVGGTLWKPKEPAKPVN